MKNNDNTQAKSNWFIIAFSGIVLVAAGIAIAFFPKMAMSIALIVSSILFFGFGITDSLTALKHKKDSDEWKTNLSNALSTLLVGIFIFATIYVPSITPMTIVIVLCIWAVLRCILMIVSFIKGKNKNKMTLLQAIITGIIGIAVFLFRDLIIASTKLIGYGLIGIGAIALLIAFGKKAAYKELANKKEDEPTNVEKIKDTPKLEEPKVATEVTSVVSEEADTPKEDTNTDENEAEVISIEEVE